MKQFFVPILFILITVLSSSQACADTIIEVEHNNGNIEKIFYVNNQEVARYTMKDNKIILIGKIPDGIAKFYYNNGNIRWEETYKNNQLNGLSKTYYENGNIQGKINMLNDKSEGISRLYYENGKRQMEAYFKNGKRNGKWIEFYTNGNIKSINIYKEDKLTSHQEYDENGKLINN